MVRRTDGEQIGVYISGLFSEDKLITEAHFAFKLDARPDGLQNIELSPYRIAVGLMPEGAPRDKKEEWVWVVAVCEKHPRQKVHFVATQRCFDEDDNEDENLPRVVTFTELQEQGELVGRFEGCTKFDIIWYDDYRQDHDGARPATGASFPSAEDYGPYGQKGDYDKNGKAIKIQKVD